MVIASITASSLEIPFNMAFKHASAERSATQTLWVEARAPDGSTGFGEGCPREYVTAESLASAQAFVAAHLNNWLASIHDVPSLRQWVADHRRDIDANPAAWTAVELALLDLLGKTGGQSVEGLLGLPELAGCFGYTAVLGDAPPRQFEAQLGHYLKAGFRAFKIKLSGERARNLEKIRALGAAAIPAAAVRADANNLWQDADAAIAELAALQFPFFAVEEPLQAGDHPGMRRLALALDTRIILDESLLRMEQLDLLRDSPERWIVNLRISKMGGLLRSLELMQAIRGAGLRAIIGAHVGETSVLTRAALTLAHSAREVMLAQEGAFGTHLLAYDVTPRPLMFGAGGILAIADQSLQPAAGWGMAMALPAAANAPAS